MKRREEIKRLFLSISSSMKRARIRGGGSPVFGAGPLPCPVMVIGEAPGRIETRLLTPFVGRAGRFFVGVLEEVSGKGREGFYITNAVKVWPVKRTKRLKTRPPTKEEVDFFAPYLMREIEMVSPQVILAVGKTALKAVSPHGEFRPGVWQKTPAGIPVMPVYHPAYILRKQRELGKNTSDLKSALRKALSKARGVRKKGGGGKNEGT